MVVESVSIVLSIVIVSIVPASLVVICKSHSVALSITEYVVASAPIAALGVTFVPDQVLTSAPITSCSIVSVMVWFVVVVDCIDHVVNWGVTVFALAAAGDNRLKSIIHLVMS